MKLQIKQFEEEVDELILTVDTIVNTYTNILDRCIDEVRELLVNKDDLTIEQLNYYISYLPILLYDVNSRIQDLGIKSDAAKMQRLDIFNTTYNNLDHGTVQKKTSIAQQASQDEQMIESIFVRVYKKMENKIEMAEMLHSSLKKILQWRISELEVTRTNIINTNLL